MYDLSLQRELVGVHFIVVSLILIIIIIPKLVGKLIHADQNVYANARGKYKLARILGRPVSAFNSVDELIISVDELAYAALF